MLNSCRIVAVTLLWHDSGVMVAIKGLAPMWLCRCWDIGCWGDVWSCCWNEIGCRVVKPPPTLLMTGTVWGCVEARPVNQQSNNQRHWCLQFLCCNSYIEETKTSVTNEKWGLPQTHDAGQRGHNEALWGCRGGRQTVQGGQSAYRRQWATTGHLRPEDDIVIMQQLVYTVETLRNYDTCSHLFGVMGIKECVAGLQLDRTDHKTSHSLSSATSGWAHGVTCDLLAVFHTWKTTKIEQPRQYFNTRMSEVLFYPRGSQKTRKSNDEYNVFSTEH